MIRALAFAPDGRLLATIGTDEAVRIWDTHAGEEVAVLRGHEGEVTSLAFAPDARRLASSGRDGTVTTLGLRPSETG